MRRHAVPAVLAAALVVTACGAPDRTPVIPTGTPSSASTAAPGTATCTPAATASYPPATARSGALMDAIVKRGRLVVGVSADTRLLGARNLTSNEFEGLDISLAHEVARALLGSPDKVQFKAISAAQRVPLLRDGADKGGVDLVARAMTMTCDRWKDVAFAGPYFTSYLKLLVRKGSPITSLPGAKGKRVCATSGSTTLAKVASVVGQQNAVGVPLTTDCMVLWQQGRVDAIAADDAILAGLAEQDPNAVIVGDTSVEREPYGLAVSKDHPEFAAFVNGVLEQLRKNGGWQAAYRASRLAQALGDRGQPAGDYSRPLQ